MVRMARSMEEEARVRLSHGPGPNRFLSDPDLLDILESRSIEKVLEFAREGVRRTLVVGLEDGGAVALSLASVGKFVTVVDPDEELLNRAKDKAEAQRCSIRMNFYASDYMERQFASSGFDMAVFFASLQRFNEPLVVVNKATRELRVSGKFFARLLVWPRAVGKGLAGDRLPRAFRDRLGRLAALPGAKELARFGTAAGFLEALARVLKVERVEAEYLLAPFLATGLTALPTWLRSRTVPALTRMRALENRLLHSDLFSSLCPFLCVYATKELSLGKTFRPPR